MPACCSVKAQIDGSSEDPEGCPEACNRYCHIHPWCFKKKGLRIIAITWSGIWQFQSQYFDGYFVNVQFILIRRLFQPGLCAFCHDQQAGFNMQAPFVSNKWAKTCYTWILHISNILVAQTQKVHHVQCYLCFKLFYGLTWACTSIHCNTSCCSTFLHTATIWIWI